jgi:hypothetical protein
MLSLKYIQGLSATNVNSYLVKHSEIKLQLVKVISNNFFEL